MKIRYFAWVRERTGIEEEDIDPPSHVKTVGDLISWLAERDEGYASAFEVPEIIRAARDQTHVSHDTPIAGTREIALFPPMTGG